jgi:hypothetical protein
VTAASALTSLATDATHTKDLSGNKKMKTTLFTTLSVLVVTSVLLALVGVRAQGANEPQPSVTWSQGSEDGAALFHLVIQQPWTDAPQRSISFHSAYVTRAGLAGLDSMRLPDTGAAAEVLEVSGDRYKCTARLNQVATWSQVRTKADVILTITQLP